AVGREQRADQAPAEHLGRTEGDVEALVGAAAVRLAGSMDVPAAEAALDRLTVGEGIRVALAVKVELDLAQLVGLAGHVEHGPSQQRLGDPPKPRLRRLAGSGGGQQREQILSQLAAAAHGASSGAVALAGAGSAASISTGAPLWTCQAAANELPLKLDELICAPLSSQKSAWQRSGVTSRVM